MIDVRRCTSADDYLVQIAVASLVRFRAEPSVAKSLYVLLHLYYDVSCRD